MGRLVIVVHIGTSVIKSIENEMDPLLKAISKLVPEDTVTLAFTSKRSMAKLETRGKLVKSFRSVLKEGFDIYDDILIIPLHMLEGGDYQAIKTYADQVEHDVKAMDSKKITLLQPLIYDDASCEKLAMLLKSIIVEKKV